MMRVVNRVCPANREEEDSKAFPAWKEPTESREKWDTPAPRERGETSESEKRDREARKGVPEGNRARRVSASTECRARKA